MAEEDEVLRFILGQAFELCIELEDTTDVFRRKEGGCRRLMGGYLNLHASDSPRT